MLSKRMLLLTFIVVLLGGMVGSIYDPGLEVFAFKKPIPVMNEVTDRWAGGIDADMRNMRQDMKEIKQDFKDLCKDVDGMRVKMAESGAVYGGIAGIVIQLFGFFGGMIFKKDGKRKGS